MSLAPRPAADLRLWQRYQSGRMAPHEILGNLTLERWERCRKAGLDSRTNHDPVIELQGLAEAIEAFGPVLAPGSPFDAFATEMARTGYSGLFCDSRGVIIAQRIAEPLRVPAALARLQEGALWSEGARGTNGMGTALFEGRPVSIIGPAHYELRNHGLACFAAPIRDIRRNVVAILDASGPEVVAAPAIHASVIATAAAIEALIVARTYDAAIPGGLFQIERLLESLPHATLLVESTGHLRRANELFRGLFPPVPASQLGALVREHLAAGPPALSSLREIPDPLEAYEVEIEPIGNTGSPMAALVHLKRRSIRSLAVSPQPTRQLPEAALPGTDPAIQAARVRAARFAAAPLPVKLLGEPGTGKETLAGAMHAASPWHEAPFVVFDCGAVAHTGSESAPGLHAEIPGPGRWTLPAAIAAAAGGTLFLRNVDRLDPEAQAVLLRLLERGTVLPRGSRHEHRVQVRVIVTSRQSLSGPVDEGTFREDLYFRLRGVTVRLPALHERCDRGDLALALMAPVTRALQQPKPLGLSAAALEWIDRQSWPGNVRELRTALEVAVVQAGDAPRVELWHLPKGADSPVDLICEASTSLRASAERAALERALEQSRGNLSHAARTLGVARSTLYRMLLRHGLAAPETRPNRR